MIWTKEEQVERCINNMYKNTCETCKTCHWSGYEEGDTFATCGYHIENFTPTSWCSYWTDKNDPKLRAYLESKKLWSTKAK